MRENIITSMFMEGGKMSHKRVLSIMFGLAGAFTIIYSVVHYKDMIISLYNSTLLFIAVMSGVATAPQIIQILKGTPATPEKETPPPITVTTTTLTNIETDKP